ncbi:POT-type proton-dependent oligopeptide transporter [Tenacibaculum jejuense]|uniref:Putative Glucose-1-phosphate adenylyltransferase n=1 Tax=Tenacibaculum jejuense TaxID=584609 RepID=A0A238U4W2_9FLAO|nr:MFS transporter [Tenacibaculum jejuense]SNR14177.1 putative Glucose-1-phosphate adenylyltransferase [Tenacibaculum jejuense]
MEKIQNQKHTKETLYYSISRMLERASYYGLRALVVLYMVGEILKMERTEALSIYGWFTASLVFSQIVGALFGDLLIGNKKSIIIGGIIQAIGAFSLCIPSTIGLYLGLFLIVLGSGFFTPNIISNFGKTYLNKTKLLDSGFTIFYLAINLGSFLGILLIGYLGEKYGYNIGFVISGILMLISIIPIFLSKEKGLDEIEKNKFSISKRILNILIAFIVVGLFWGLYELSSIRTFDLQLQLSEISTLDIPSYLWQSLNSIFILPISIIAIVLWTYFYSSQFFKLMLGFIFGAISFGILFVIPEVPTEQNTIIYLFSLLFLAISEIHIAPIIHSILTKYSNPKYLAILISLAFLPTKLISLIFGLFNDKLYDNPMLGLKIGIVGMTIIGIGMIGYVIINRKTTYNNV